MQRDKVILVNTNDVPLCKMDKLEAHIKGKLHRAFSVFIFNQKEELLLQQRAEQKYHGAGLWTNTCCSHPQWGENVRDSAMERLEFEMGIKCDVQFQFSFVYEAKVENQLIEHEFDHVFFGYSNETPRPNALEVQNYQWKSLQKISADIHKNPEIFTIWFKIALPKVIDIFKK